MFPDQNQIVSISDVGSRWWSSFRRQQPFSEKRHIAYLIETGVTMLIQRSLRFLFLLIDRLKKKTYMFSAKI